MANGLCVEFHRDGKGHVEAVPEFRMRFVGPDLKEQTLVPTACPVEDRCHAPLPVTFESSRLPLHDPPRLFPSGNAFPTRRLVATWMEEGGRVANHAVRYRPNPSRRVGAR